MQKVRAAYALILAWALVTPISVSSAATGDSSKTGSSKTDSSKTDSSTSESSKTTASNATQSAASSSGQSTGPIESQILAFEALHNRAAEVARFLQQIAPPPTEVIVLDSAQIGVIPGYQAFVAQSERLRSEFCAALRETGKAPRLAIPTASQFSAAAAAVTAVLALFKQTTSVTANALTLSDESFVAAVGEAIDHQKMSLYYPTLYPIGLGNTPPVLRVPNTLDDACPADTTGESVMQRLGALEYLRSASASAVTRIESEAAPKKAADQNVHDRLGAVNSTFDSIMGALTAADPATGRTMWESVLNGERLFRHLKPTTVVVELKVQAAGGEMTTRDGPFFFHGAKYDYSGGVVVTALVFDPSTGLLRAAKTFWEMTGNRERTTFASYKNK